MKKNNLIEEYESMKVIQKLNKYKIWYHDA
jgi:hypothetical protein